MIYLLIGILLTLLGIILSFKIFLHFTFIFVAGIWLIFHYINAKSKKETFIQGNILKTSLLFIIPAIITLIIELFVRYNSAVWQYNFDFFNFNYDFWLSMMGWLVFFPAALDIYTFFSSKARIKYKFNVAVFALAALSLALIILIKDYKIKFALFIFCIFLITDFLCFVLNKKSIISEILSKNLAIVPTWILVALPIEILNVNYNFVWRYYPPFSDASLFGIPIIVLMGWIPLAGIYINSALISKSLIKRIWGHNTYKSP